jgi:hypothetical protein
MSITEAQTVKRFYENELNGYAYLEVQQTSESPAATPPKTGPKNGPKNGR